jgi:hypothetical protein
VYSRSDSRTGSQNCVSRLGKENPAGMTPMIVIAPPSSVSVRPITPGSAAKRSTHIAWLNTRVAGAPSRSSSTVKIRPSAGGVPSNCSPSPVMPAPSLKRSAMPWSITVIDEP